MYVRKPPPDSCTCIHEWRTNIAGFPEPLAGAERWNGTKEIRHRRWLDIHAAAIHNHVFVNIGGREFPAASR
ncbi:hypothetical protein OL599_21440 [Rhodovastum sp. RN2-1]|uniref:Uncharacterized protein n=1 Tax=Limobrevibacterium gyesilva TaxID=2991712 RepID=A0AA42CFX8_9PROT|nr:hypothetical protein [Limobrevibacterium gyesilva]